jgi:hypothetical protein
MLLCHRGTGRGMERCTGLLGGKSEDLVEMVEWM